MSDKYSWCQGPYCHKHQTQDRVRGVKGNKYLRTRKVRWYSSEQDSKWNYFCSNHCLHQYIDEHLRAFIAIAPRPEPLETSCEVVTRKVESTRYDWQERESIPYVYTEKTIVVDNNNN